jgi:hypothetical protein
LSIAIRHLFLPHHTNNHRARILHIDSLFIYLLIFAALHVFSRFGSTTLPDVLGYATDIHTEQLFEYTNSIRAEQGLPLLKFNGLLSDAASRKAQDMFSNNYWAHNSPGGSTPWDFIVSSGYSYKVAGENLAKNFDSSRTVVDAWLASPSHRENILKSTYQDVGFAVVNGTLNGEETTLVVQMFGSTGTRAVSAVSAAPPEAVATVPPQLTSVPEEVAVPVVITEVASQTERAVTPITSVASAFSRVTKRPILNISAFWRELSFVFLGGLVGILILDAWLIARRRTVRITGHNFAHIIFLGSFLILTQFAQRGSLL